MFQKVLEIKSRKFSQKVKNRRQRVESRREREEKQEINAGMPERNNREKMWQLLKK